MDPLEVVSLMMTDEQGTLWGKEVVIKPRKIWSVSQYWSKDGGVQCPRARHRVCGRAAALSLFRPLCFPVSPSLSLSLSSSVPLCASISRCLARRDIHRREVSSELTSYSWFPIKDDRRRKGEEIVTDGGSDVLFLTRETRERPIRMDRFV